MRHTTNYNMDIYMEFNLTGFPQNKKHLSFTKVFAYVYTT